MEDDISSINHHYIPVFFLKGFTDVEGLLYRYDKEIGSIKHKGPKGAFVEKHRNTGILVHPETGEVHRSDLAETTLAHYDAEMAKALHMIRSSQPNDNILADKVLLYKVKLLVNSLFWRSPVNEPLLNKVIDNTSFEDLGFGIFDKNGERHLETEDLLKTIDLYRKFYPILLMLASYTSKYKGTDDSTWGVYYLPNDYHIITDNPVILKEYKDPSSIQEEIIFPVARNLMVVSTKKYKTPILPLLFAQKVDLLLYHTASRYIASSNRAYLEFLGEQVKIHNRRPNWAENLRQELFNYFY